VVEEEQHLSDEEKKPAPLDVQEQWKRDRLCITPLVGVGLVPPKQEQLRALASTLLLVLKSWHQLQGVTQVDQVPSSRRFSNIKTKVSAIKH
jgi:hypothetical protein